MGLTKNRFSFIAILSSCFFLLDICLVGLKNHEALREYIAIGTLVFILGTMTLYYVFKTAGNMLISFIFVQLLQFGCAIQSTIHEPDKTTFFIYLLTFASVAIVFFFYDAFNTFIYGKYMKLCKVLAIIATSAVTIIIFFVGKGQDNTRNWINIMGVSIQLTELLKPLFLYFLAILICRKESYLADNMSVIKSGLLLLSFAVILLISNELGTIMILIVTWLGFLFYYTDNRKLFYIMLVIGIVSVSIVLILAYTVINSNIEVSNPIVLKLIQRLGVYVDIKTAGYDSAYQINQNQEAFVLGSLLGSSSEYYHIVNGKNDMIYAHVNLTFGCIFGLLLFASFIILYISSEKSIVKSTPSANSLLATIINILIISQVFVNILGCLNLLPMTGVGLPFSISDGGTYTLISSALFAYVIRSTCTDKLKLLKKKPSMIIDGFFSTDEEELENE